MPFATPTCWSGLACPISRRKYKKDISYVESAEADRLSDELKSFRLARYHYKNDAPGTPSHLGFIIDDVAPSPSVTADGEHVDLYGYTTMAVAALQLQAREIAALEHEVETLRRDLSTVRSKPASER
jgi:hypothetical protein